MAQFFNECEIEDLCERAARLPEVAPFARYLTAWVGIVNSNSDGWPYWRAGREAGCKLAALISAALGGAVVTRAQLTRAVGGIKAAASRQLRHGYTMPTPAVQL